MNRQTESLIIGGSIYGTVVMLVVVIALFATPSGDPLRTLQERAASQHSILSHTETTQDDSFYWEAKQLALTLSHDFNVETEFSGPNVGSVGTFYPHERKIRILESLHWTSRLETLAHEAGHLLAPPALETYGDSETFAEGVSVLVCYRLGDKGVIERSAKYLAAIKGSLHILTDYRQDIERVAKFLTPS